ncbi:rod shape-determining protein MreD [Propionispira arboris]|uniref:Rod shape-determining protein MreD n=1 Tax=Propionispira arboris TaxID=84035 RepID=A0A1H7CNK9_9FIRM|nr:rod shape-determining protein MreD [Propionispira arboris]SEJ91191.1 rod shape-determining protein MreD [Propionispira arboris]
MKKCFIWGICLVVLYILQSSLLPIIAYNGVSPDILLIVVISFSLLRGSRFGFLMGFSAGLLEDLASGTFFGMNTFCKMILGYAFGLVEHKVFKENFFLPIMSMIIATSLNYFISAVLMVLLGYRFNLVHHMEHILLPLLLYNVIFAFPVHKFVYKICELVKEKR